MLNVATDRLPALLRSAGPEREAAARELRALLVRAAVAYLSRQQYPAEAFGADSYAQVAEDYAQKAFVVILARLDTFRGECRFTTWAYRIVINLIADEARRRLWRRRPLPTEDTWAGGQGSTEPAEAGALRHEVWGVVQQIIDHELTARQRQALVGRIFEEKPLVVLATELGTTKDNVYTLLHDARKHLKRALLARGYSEGSVLAAFAGADV